MTLQPDVLYYKQLKPSIPHQEAAKRRNAIEKYGEPKKINGFDVDGVISLGIHPGPTDVIITGRSFIMGPETLKILHSRGIFNAVYFNPLHRSLTSREQSGEWKAEMINRLGCIEKFFEDDPIQWKIIQEKTNVKVVYVMSDVVEK